jgi:hypothetical protein
MRMLAGKGRLLLVAVALACIGTPARADELLMMPYSCRMAGGEPVLTPAPDEVHQIIGHREHLPFSVCSPANPGRCRRWTLYRFELICGGVRVPWVAVAAAAAQQRNQRAWAANGRLHLEMPPRWNMPDNDPCAREWGYGERWGYGGLARYCAEHRFDAPPFVVEMPAGFAPTFGIGAFVAAGPPGALQGMPTAALPGGPAAIANAPATGFPAGAAPSVPRPSPAAPPPVASAPPAPLPSPPTRSARAEVPTATAPTESAAKPAPAKKAPPKAEQEPPVAAPAPIIPRIINSSEPAPGPALASPAALPPPVAPPPQAVPSPAANGPPPAMPAPPPTASTPPPTASAQAPTHLQPPAASGPPPLTDSTQSEATRTPPPPDIADRSSAVTRTAPGSATIAVNLIAAVGNNPTSVAVAMAGLVMLVLAAFAFVRQREQTHLSNTATRDLATLSLDGGHLVVTEHSRPANVGVAPLPPDIGDAIPRTLNEALHILGMGVTAAAGEVAIKKVVDGLRLSWHPDYAVSSADRKLRELRTKQINAAWDIIKGKRPPT